jgi:hypothetical protein
MVMAETVRQLQINAAVVAGLVVVQRTQRPFFFFSSRRLNKQKSMGWLTAGLGVLVPRSTPTVAIAITITAGSQGRSVLGLARRDHHLLSRRDPTPFTTRA